MFSHDKAKTLPIGAHAYAAVAVFAKNNLPSGGPPVEEPPNAPKKPPIKEPGNPPGKPPTPQKPPVKEPGDVPTEPPVKEPPPEDPNQPPPTRRLMHDRRYQNTVYYP
jgi:hypothetical protein